MTNKEKEHLMEKRSKDTQRIADSQFKEAEENVQKPYSARQYFFTEFKQNPANKGDKHAATKAGEVWKTMTEDKRAPFVNYNLDGAYQRY